QAAHAAAVAGLPSLDQEFLRRVEEAVLRHLGEETFGVDELGSAIDTSRTQVYRKLKPSPGNRRASTFEARGRTGRGCCYGRGWAPWQRWLIRWASAARRHSPRRFRGSLGTSPARRFSSGRAQEPRRMRDAATAAPTEAWPLSLAKFN
ncbi:hypothetical protein, partial [Hymenobacter agri]